MSKGPVRAAFDRSVNAARKQRIVSAVHSGTIEAARTLADRIDQDLPGDNVSHSVFLKYMNDLGLTVKAGERKPVEGVARPNPLLKLQRDLQANHPDTVARG